MSPHSAPEMRNRSTPFSSSDSLHSQQRRGQNRNPSNPSSHWPAAEAKRSRSIVALRNLEYQQERRRQLEHESQNFWFGMQQDEHHDDHHDASSSNEQNIPSEYDHHSQEEMQRQYSSRIQPTVHRPLQMKNRNVADSRASSKTSSGGASSQTQGVSTRGHISSNQATQPLRSREAFAVQPSRPHDKGPLTELRRSCQPSSPGRSRGRYHRSEQVLVTPSSSLSTGDPQSDASCLNHCLLK